MKSEKIIEFIRHPEKINNDDLRELHTLVERYPYFQTARILYLKALYLLGGVRFRSELKASTVHLTDHKQFFRYLNNQIGFDPGLDCGSCGAPTCKALSKPWVPVRQPLKIR